MSFILRNNRDFDYPAYLLTNTGISQRDIDSVLAKGHTQVHLLVDVTVNLDSQDGLAFVLRAITYLANRGILVKGYSEHTKAKF